MTRLLWIALCLGGHRYQVEVFEPEGHVQSKTVVRATTDAELIRLAEALRTPQQTFSWGPDV